jgi:hypothetical protein
MSALETSVTLEDIFAVVEAKRVPLAPELAGYLTLEVADGTDAGGGSVEPRTVYISEEGTVALVRPKKDAPTGDAEASVRAILLKLLEASGSSTPALGAAAKRKPGTGLPALVEELEAALIPVNRAAGRRALARLAREVKRVMLGVGRNASAPPVGLSKPPPRKEDEPKPTSSQRLPASPPKVVPRAGAIRKPVSAPRAPIATAKKGPFPSDEAGTTKRQNELAELAASMTSAPDSDRSAPLPKKPAAPLGLTPPPLPGAPALGASPPVLSPPAQPAQEPALSPEPPRVVDDTPGLPAFSPEPPAYTPALSPGPPPAFAEPEASPFAPAVLSPAPPPFSPDAPVAQLAPVALPAPSPSAGTTRPLPVRAQNPLPPPPASKSGPPVVPPPPRRDALGAVAEVRPDAGGEKLFGNDEVDDLLATFEVSGGSETQVRNELKAIAGLGPTPPPPDARTLAELTKDIGKDLPKKIAPPEGDGVEALLALADASGPLAPPLPPAGFNARAKDAPLPGLAPREPQPGAPKLPEVPPESHPPVSPLVPSAALPGAPPAFPAPVDVAAPIQRPPSPAGEQPPIAPALSLSASGRRPRSESGKMAASGRRTTSAAQSGGRAPRQPRAPKTGLAMLILTLVVLVAGGVAIYMWKPAFFTGAKKRPAPSASASVSATPAPPPRCKVALVVTDVPANAEILLRMGQSPLDVERMPVGTRLEFVATAEGYAPKRAIVKAESTWDKGPDGKPRIDVPIQLDPSKAKPGTVDPWPAAEPGSQVGGSGSPGTVHVVVNVRGSEVWLLAGLGPEARIEQLKCDGDIDVLLAGPPSLRKRLHVSEKDIQAAQADPQGNKVVTVTAK